MCLPNIFSLSPRKSPSPCEASRRARAICLRRRPPSPPLRPRPALLRFPQLPLRAVPAVLAAPAAPSTPAPSAPEPTAPAAPRRSRPASIVPRLPRRSSGKSFPPFRARRAKPRPRRLARKSCRPVRGQAGSAQESPLPSDLWQGIDAPALERLLGGVSVAVALANACHLDRAVAGARRQRRRRACDQAERALEGQVASIRRSRCLPARCRRANRVQPRSMPRRCSKRGVEDEACAVAIDPPPQMCRKRQADASGVSDPGLLRGGERRSARRQSRAAACQGSWRASTGSVRGDREARQDIIEAHRSAELGRDVRLSLSQARSEIAPGQSRGEGIAGTALPHRA